MNVNFFKRFLAYLIDIILVGTIMGIISAIFTTKNATVLSNQFLELNEQVINTKLDFGIYYSRVADITLSLDRENFMINIINCVIIILYFVVLPLYKNGQTLGKKIFKIKIVREDREDLTANELIIRNIVVNGLLNTFLAFCLVFLLSGFEYFTITSILGFIQFVLVVVSACMIIFRKDKKGLHDIITKTKVVYEEV